MGTLAGVCPRQSSRDALLFEVLLSTVPTEKESEETVISDCLFLMGGFILGIIFTLWWMNPPYKEGFLESERNKELHRQCLEYKKLLRL